MADEPKDASQSLPNSYPPAEDPQVDALKEQLSEKETLLKEKEEQLEKLKAENDTLSAKLEEVEKEKLATLAANLVDLKISKGLLTEEGKEEAIEKMSELSSETLEVLYAELSSVQIKLSEPAVSETTQPVDPVDAGEKGREEELKEARLKLFGHEESPEEYYRKELDAGRL